MYKLKKVGKLDIPKLGTVAYILNACGKDMAQKYDLHHWDNSYIKSLVIVGLCAFKNDIYLMYDECNPVATFMTKRQYEYLHFEKLGTLPSKSGKGIGTLCIAKIEKIAKDADCKKIVLEVYESSQHAVLFYKHKGYKTIETKETLKYKEIIMEKSI